MVCVLRSVVTGLLAVVVAVAAVVVVVALVPVGRPLDGLRPCGLITVEGIAEGVCGYSCGQTQGENSS